jgi:hypothetical protein
LLVIPEVRFQFEENCATARGQSLIADR